MSGIVMVGSRAGAVKRYGCTYSQVQALEAFEAKALELQWRIAIAEFIEDLYLNIFFYFKFKNHFYCALFSRCSAIYI